MDVSPLIPPELGQRAATRPAADPRLQPTPDYGTLGPSSDIATRTTDASENETRARSQLARRIGPSVAIAAGVLMALLVGNVGSALAAWNHIASLFSPRVRPGVANSARIPTRDLDRQQPQAQAEALLERAVSRDDHAPDQIASRVDQWRGRLKWDSRLSTLTTAALNSSDMHVRTSAVEVELAAYGLTKSESSLDNLIQQSNSSDHARKIWALWTLGLMGNRGVESERVVEVLSSHLQNKGKNNKNDEDSRRWAAEGLALVGTSSTIAPLLQAMHDDPSPLVRERAACSLAQSGMLTQEQRLTAVPQLLNDTDDPSLDAQTHAWAFQALMDITGQRFPNDSAAWRSWYASSHTD
jgi:HEAT repeat protein